MGWLGAPQKEPEWWFPVVPFAKASCKAWHSQGEYQVAMTGGDGSKAEGMSPAKWGSSFQPNESNGNADSK